MMMCNTRPYKSVKIYIERTIILNKNHSVFSVWSTVAVQWEDEGPWIHRGIVEPNEGDHRHWVTKTGKIITCNTN